MSVDYASLKQVSEIDKSDFTKEKLNSTQPFIVRGLITDWPLVKAETIEAQQAYLLQKYNQKLVHALIAPEQEQGRYFYNSEITDFNFSRENTSLESIIERIRLNPDNNAYYVGSTAVEHILPGFRSENDVELLKSVSLVSLWLGNASRIAAHYDIPDNLACVAAGKRRFTLFPPEQLDNLYIGPLDFTPAGQSASLVDFQHPDFQSFPKFKQALAAAQVAELAAGDALFIPSMWWHHVEALSKFNILVNYWWRPVDIFMAAPTDALYHAMLSIRDLPENQRKIWQEMFDHYIFNPKPQEHIPPASRGVLNPIDDVTARKLRAMLLNKLNR
ncbi:cupin-like domain-containing protein [Catenovulum maritimum]|uniref:Cupin n=1 Tax=Catenovulum maritimum TaxID=1513271 RepID=A0A0J8GUR4_9ALTE|nr:cupin-like domain-containing protein [Catenovulum maritimum]KMT64438.1 cupin [Catenovulum maritimum]